MIDLAKLKALALAATRGGWTHKRFGVIVAGPFRQYANGSTQSQIASFGVTCSEDLDEPDKQLANADFSAAADPETVLELIARIEILESEARTLAINSHETIHIVGAELNRVRGQRDRLKTRVRPSEAHLEDYSVSALAVEQVDALTDEQIVQAAVVAVRAGKLSWTGFNKDDEGKFTVPALAPYHLQLARAILAASRTAAPVQAAPEGITDTERLDHIDKKSHIGASYGGITSLNTLIHMDDYVAGGTRYAIDCMIERKAAAPAPREAL